MFFIVSVRINIVVSVRRGYAMEMMIAATDQTRQIVTATTLLAEFSSLRYVYVYSLYVFSNSIFIMCCCYCAYYVIVCYNPSLVPNPTVR